MVSPIRKHSGFTIIEIIVVLVVMMLLLVGVIVSYNSYNTKQVLRQAGMTLKTNIRLAQTKALSGKKPINPLDPSDPSYCPSFDRYEVRYVNATSYRIVAVCKSLIDGSDVVPPGNPEDSTISLPSTVKFTSDFGTISFKTSINGPFINNEVPITDVSIPVEDLSSKISCAVTVAKSGTISDTCFFSQIPTPTLTPP